MAQSTRARRPEIVRGLRGPQSVLLLAKDEPIPSVQVTMPGDDEHSSVAIKGHKAGDRLEHWIQKAGTAQPSEEAEKAPAATDTDEVEYTSPENNGGNRVVQLSEAKTTIGQVWEKS